MKKLVLTGKPDHIMGQLASFIMAYGDMKVVDVVEDWEEAQQWEEYAG